MINRKIISGDQVLPAIKNGEFGNDVIVSARTVVVIMTQDWCPQWKDMSSWIYGLKTDLEIDVYELVYNNKDYHNEFMKFKEDKWGNHSIPYLRYYRDGMLYKETNYVSSTEFLRIVSI